MSKLILPRSLTLAYAGLLVTSAFAGIASADDAEGVVRLNVASEGIVRVSNTSAEEVVRGQSPRQMARQCRREGFVTESCPEDAYHDGHFSLHSCPGKAAFDGWFCGQAASYRMRNQYAAAHLQAAMQEDCHEKAAWARCKFGYFIPTGSCGKGTPPFGHYSMVYPVNPQHFDGRDGQVYAAQGYGGAVSVPMAPVVNHTYNYGWGVPSSRLTPVSHPVSPAQANAYQNNQIQVQPVQQ